MNNAKITPIIIPIKAPTIGIKEHITDKTLSIHHLEYSWASEKEKQAWNIFKERIKK